MFPVGELFDEFVNALSFDRVLLLIAAVSSLVAMATGLLKLRKQVEEPVIVAKTLNLSQSPELLNRMVEFKQLSDASAWVVDEIRISRLGKKWIGTDGEPVRNPYGEFVGYEMVSNWERRLTFNPPVRNGSFLLHPEAPKGLTISFRVVLRGQPGVRRRLKVFLE